MKYRAIPILIFLLVGLTLPPLSYAQPQIEEKAPGFITSTLDGKRIALKDYWEQHGKKVLVLSFFATWCHPCKEDLKYLQKIQDQYRSRGLEVFCVLTQDSAKMEAVKKFMHELGVELPVLLDENGIIGKRYGVTGLPCNFVVRRDGFLKAKYLGYSSVVKQQFEKQIGFLLSPPSGRAK